MGVLCDPSTIDELFKKVRPDEILEDLRQLGVNVNPEAFRNPKPEESLGLYSLAIQVVFGKTLHDTRPEELYGRLLPTPSDLPSVDFSAESVDFLKHGIGNLRLWRYCQRLHSVLGLREIERYELFNPTPESFNALISSFVIYLRFRAALHSLFEAPVSELDALAEQGARLSEDIARLIPENKKFEGVMLEGSGEHASLLKRKLELEGRLLGANDEFTRLRSLKGELELELARVKNLLNDTKLSKTKARHTLDDLSEHFAFNLETASKLYEQLKAEDASQNARLEALRAKADDLRARSSALVEASAVFDRLKRNLSDHYRDVVVPHVESLELSRKASAQTARLEARLRELGARRDSLVADLDRQAKLLEERLRALRAECQARVEQAKALAAETKRGAELTSRKAEEVRSMVDQVNARVLDTRRNSQDVFASLDSGLARLAESGAAYDKRLARVSRALAEST